MSPTCPPSQTFRPGNGIARYPIGSMRYDSGEVTEVFPQPKSPSAELECHVEFQQPGSFVLSNLQPSLHITTHLPSVLILKFVCFYFVDFIGKTAL